MNTLKNIPTNFLSEDQLLHYNNLVESSADMYRSVMNEKKFTLELLPFFGKKMDEICSDIALCEKSGLDEPTITVALKPIIALVSSDFALRLRNWPRGYPGDFETIDYLYFKKNSHPAHSLEWMVNEYLYQLPVTQQHRNKIMYQADLIRDAILKNKNAKIVVLACGGSIDLSLCEEEILNSNATIYIQDHDHDAIEQTLIRCNKIADKLHPIEKDTLHAIKELSKTPGFDLIVAGGVFDYFNDRVSTHVIHQVYELLKQQGQFFFTNISPENQVSSGMEYILNWRLIMRSEEKLYELCLGAGVIQNNVFISRENSQLTFLVHITKT
jgi:extracellular factor (EF) 3-hydroxypalmitic acid methyl ester biosynthesis protein